MKSALRFSVKALIPSSASSDTKTLLIASLSIARPRSSGAPNPCVIATTSSASLLVTGVAGVAAIVVLSLWGRPLLAWLEHHSPARSGGWLPHVWRLGHLALDGLGVLRSWQANLALGGLSLLSWTLAASTNYLLFKAFGFPLSFAAGALLLVVLQVGIAPPSLPGKLGVFHYLTVLALSFFGITHNAALTYALVLYAVALLSKVLVGGVWLAWLRWRPGRGRPPADPSTTA